jgi:hypothetical protein
VSPQQVVPYLCEGDIERIVFDGPSRVIDVGVRERFFTGALRRAIEVRDRRCTTPPAAPWLPRTARSTTGVRYTDGGLTTQDNGRCRCATHNLQRENHPELDPDQRPPPPDDDP